jgi:transposase
MPEAGTATASSTAVRTDLAAILVSLSPSAGTKMSKHIVVSGDVGALLKRLRDLQRQARDRVGKEFPLIVIQEAGLAPWSATTVRSPTTQNLTNQIAP